MNTARFIVADVPCTHKQVTHICGTNARARLDGCRCDPCLEARRAYDKAYKRRVGEFPIDPPTMVDAEPVYQHVESLIAQGMGPKRIAQVSGVPHGAISKLVYGDYVTLRRRSRRVRRGTAEKLLATTLDLADGAKVDATEAKALVAELVARGWAKAEIGRRIQGPQAKSLQAVRTPLVQAGTLRTLRKLAFEPVPPRVHNPTGRLYNAETGHWCDIPASTPGVPVETTETYPEWLRAEDRRRLWEALELARQRVGMFLEEDRLSVEEER